jgi:hypothetical protein
MCVFIHYMMPSMNFAERVDMLVGTRQRGVLALLVVRAVRSSRSMCA